MRRAIHTIHMDDNHIAKIREAAIRKVDQDTDTFRPELLNRLPLTASPSPRKSCIPTLREIKLSLLDNDIRPIVREQKRQPTRRSVYNDHRRKSSNKRKVAAERKACVNKARLLVQESTEYLRAAEQKRSSTPAEIKLARSLHNANTVLLRSYKKSIRQTRALDAEQKEWRNQSPSQRGVNTSPDKLWSTKRGKAIKKITTEGKTKNPPAYKSDNLLFLSPRTARRSTSKYGTLIARTPTRCDSPYTSPYTSVGKKLYF